MDDRQKKVLEQIKGLIAKANGGTTEEEAASCMSLAHKLLEKYNLAMSDIREDAEQAVDREALDEMYMTPWRNAVFGALLNLYFCDGFHSQWLDKPAYDKAKVVWNKKWQAFQMAGGEGWEHTRAERALWKAQPQLGNYYRPQLVVVGREHNRAVVVEMIPYLFRTVMRMGQAYAKGLSDEDLAMEGVTRRVAGLAFERGCGDRVATRINSMAYEAKLAQRKANKGTGSSVTLYDAFGKENTEFLATLDLRKRKSGGLDTSGDHADAGARAGDDVSLAMQVGADGKPARAKALPAPAKALPAK